MSTAEELKRLRLSRRGFRAHLATLTTSLTEIRERCKEHPLQEDDTVTLSNLLEQFNRKKEIISGLDTKILELIDEKDLEAEIVESEEAISSISQHIAQVKRLLNTLVPPQPGKKNITAKRDASKEDSPPPTSKGNAETDAAATRENVIRLPRLNIPTFSGDALSWEPFWDSFEAAVHTNTTLSDVQKLTYLRSQLQGSAAQVISGFTLTGRNYENSITLLKDRFGQPHKLKHAHMQALLNLPNPVDSLSSLQTFYDTVEGHVRSLATLGKNIDSYGDLLVTIIRSRLPPKTWKSIAREHGSGEWTFETLQTALKQEIQILELEVQPDQTNPRPTASFYTSTSKPRNRPQQVEPVKRSLCIYCKGPHASIECTIVTKPEQRR